jgi:hypothetical protein
MRTSATPHADAFSTRSLSTRLAIAFVPTAAGLLTKPPWCRLCRKALAPSAPPRCARRGRLLGTTPKGSRIKVAGRSHIRCGFDTKRWVRVERCRFAGCQCHVAEACLGGPESLCGDGYHGLRCGECSNGYYKISSRCTKCGSNVLNYSPHCACDVRAATSRILQMANHEGPRGY